jgi:hypothetical protein
MKPKSFQEGMTEELDLLSNVKEDIQSDFSQFH